MTPDTREKALVLMKRQDAIMTRIEGSGIVGPSISDKEWALDLASSFWSFSSAKASKFLKSVKLGHLWRVAYAVQLNDFYDDKDKFISKSVGQKALFRAAEKNHESVVEYMLNESFALKYGYNQDFLHTSIRHKNIKALAHLIRTEAYDIENDDGDLLSYASAYGDNNLCIQLLQQGLKSEPGLMKARNDYNSWVADSIKTAVIKVKGFEQAEEKEETQQQKNIIKIEPTTNSPIWDAMSDDIIVKHEIVPNATIELETIFNFQSRNIQTICCMNKNDIPAVTMVIQNFQDLESDSILFEAWQKLKDLDKNPASFTGNDNFTIVKPKRDQKINIEKG